MGLIVSTELAWPKLGYDACYARRSGWPLMLSTKELHKRGTWWETHDGVAVARGFSLGLRQFAMMHDAHDANFASVWLIDATNGVDTAKQELELLCGVDASQLAIIQCPRENTYTPNEVSYYTNVEECTDSDLLKSARFIVVYKRDIQPNSIGMLVMNCVDMHGSFSLLCVPGEPIETIALKVQKLRHIHDAKFENFFVTEHDHPFNVWFYNAFVIVSGVFVQPACPTAEVVCSISNYAMVASNDVTLHV